ncbi:hypothetical protein F4679DRAFT_544417, partial [Xylaria curta]
MGVIHGDIKPDNILVFRSIDGSLTAKITDFGFSIRCSHDNARLVLPQSQPWCAPELDEYPEFTPEQARRTDIFSFGMLALWFLFDKGLLSNQFESPRSPDTYESKFRVLEVLKNMKQESSLLQLANHLITTEESLTLNTKQTLRRFFSRLLPSNPEDRYINIEDSLELLVAHDSRVPSLALNPLGNQPAITLPAGNMEDVYLPVDSDFKLFSSLYVFYGLDYRLRTYTLQSLERVVVECPNSPLSTQLALCYALGFGRPQGGQRLEPLLYEEEDFKTHLHEIVNSSPTFHMYEGTLYESILDVGHYSPQSLVEHYRTQDILQIAESFTKMDIRCLENLLKPENSLLVPLKSTLVLIMAEQGRWEDAERLQKEVLVIQERIEGRDDHYTLMGTTNLAGIYYEQGRWKESEMLELEVAERMERLLGREHRLTLGVKSMLASSYLKQGKVNEAEILWLNALDTSRKLLGPEHPDTVHSMLHLAVAYQEKADWGYAPYDGYNKSEKLVLEAEAIGRRVFGKEHSFNLIAKSLMASIYRKQEKFAQAESLEVLIMDLYTKRFGREHPDTLTSMTNLASTFAHQDKLAEAEEILVEVVDLSQKTLGHEHPDTLIRTNNLADVYRSQERFKEAAKLQVQTLNIAKRTLGHEHPETLNYMESLIATYWAQRRSRPAKKLQAELLAIRHDPSVLMPMTSVASEYLIEGQLAMAERVLVELLEIQEREFKDHHDTLHNKEVLAITYFQQDKFKDAERILVEILEYQGKNGHREPRLLELLASTYADQGNFQEAQAAQVEVLNMWRNGIGEHPSPLASMMTLASIYLSQEGQDKREEARKILAEALDVSQEMDVLVDPEIEASMAVVQEILERPSQHPASES